MNRLFSFGLAALVLATAPAMAADLNDPYEPVAPEVYATSTTYNWTGPYAGIGLGWQWGLTHGVFGGHSSDIDTDGFAGSLYGGYNFQVTPNVVLGGEADVTWADLQGDKSISGTTFKTRTDWEGSIRARGGVSFDRVLAYGTGGIAFANQKITNESNGADRSEGNVGWTVGGGVEGAVTDNIIARGEYLYQSFGKQTYGGGTKAKEVDFDTSLLRAGVAYKF
jgi:outer membrane immunogenic protein